jgi:hypothetical protein
VAVVDRTGRRGPPGRGCGEWRRARVSFVSPFTFLLALPFPDPSLRGSEGGEEGNSERETEREQEG